MPILQTFLVPVFFCLGLIYDKKKKNAYINLFIQIGIIFGNADALAGMGVTQSDEFVNLEPVGALIQFENS